MHQGMWICEKCGREFKKINQDHYCGEVESIDQYIYGQDEEVRPILNKIRDTIHAAAPNAVEKISWQMPTFRQNENLIHFAAFKNHISIFPGSEASTAFADKLAEYKTAKGTIQFPLSKPIPYELIAEITQWRVSQAVGKKKAGAMDFKKEFKNLYQPKTVPAIVDVPEMNFITIDGKGDPNTCGEYASALEVLYGLSYTIKMNNKAILEYVMPPLEGFWSVADEFRGGGAPITDKSKFIWTMLIRQPDFVTPELFESSKNLLAKKKPNLDISKARLEKIIEGLCVQVMHIGSYDDEPATIAALDKYALENGYAMDIDDSRRHHEIYISDPRKTAPEKLKTIIRHPIKKG